MGLVTEDLASLLTEAEPTPVPEENPFGAGLQSAWQHAVYRFRKWLRTTLAAHGEPGDGLTR